MKTNDFKLNQILDGGIGREIEIRGYPFQRPEWSAFILDKNPEALIDIHSDFIDKGARIITTNTYAIVPFHIGEDKFDKEGKNMIRIACEMALKAKEKHADKNIQIAFSVPPIFGSYRADLFEANPEKAKQLYDIFLSPTYEIDYIDFYLCETLSCIGEASILMNFMQKTTKPYCLSFNIDEQKFDIRGKGQKLTDIAAEIEKFEKKPLAVMINCCPAEAISKVLPDLRKCLPKQIKVGCYPNNFQCKQMNKYDPNKTKTGHKIREDISVEMFQNMCNQWISLGAEIIGGCCAIGPKYMPAIVSAFDRLPKQ